MEKLGLILIYGILNLLYFPLNRRPAKYYWHIKMDEKIPLWPPMILVYLSYFLFFPGGAISLIFSEQFFLFAKSMIIAQSLGDLFWWLFPNGVKRPVITGGGWFKNRLRQLYQHDRYDGNACPSAHVFHALIVGYFLGQMLPEWSILIYFWPGLIIISTVLIKQHYVLDVFGGILVGAIAILLW